jgi:hypothetical protein
VFKGGGPTGGCAERQNFRAWWDEINRERDEIFEIHKRTKLADSESRRPGNLQEFNDLCPMNSR